MTPHYEFRQEQYGVIAFLKRYHIRGGGAMRIQMTDFVQHVIQLQFVPWRDWKNMHIKVFNCFTICVSLIATIIKLQIKSFLYFSIFCLNLASHN
jgi:hypothetical protein